MEINKNSDYYEKAPYSMGIAVIMDIIHSHVVKHLFEDYYFLLSEFGEIMRIFLKFDILVKILKI